MSTLAPRPLPRVRLGRSALFVFGATAALSGAPLVGCSDDGADKPRDASTPPSTGRDARVGDDASVSNSHDAAPAAPTDAALARDARTNTPSASDAGDAGRFGPPPDAGAWPDDGVDAGEDIGIPIYASVAQPLRREQRELLPAFARPASVREPAPRALDTRDPAARTPPTSEDPPVVT